MSIIYQLTSLVQQLPEIGVFLGWVNRILELKQEFKRHSKASEKSGPSAAISQFNATSIFSSDDEDEALLSNVSISFSKRTLIIGSSGSGKTSILRTARYLTKNPLQTQVTTIEHCMVLPQRGREIILPRANWLAQLSYPYTWEKLRYKVKHLLEKDVIKIIDFLELDMVSSEKRDIFSEKTDWAQKYSPGEIQRILLGRLFLQQPQYAILDESVSSLDSGWRKKIFERLEKSKIIYSTISHDTDLKIYHETVFSTEHN